MNGSYDLGDGLELLVVNSIDFTSAKDLRVVGVVKQGVDLQRRVFEEQGVSFPDKRALLAEDSAGTPEEPGSLDGSSPNYHHLYLLHSGRLIGMRVSEELEVRALGRVVFDYLPPLVTNAEAGRTYFAGVYSVMSKGDIDEGIPSNAVMPIRPVQLLSLFSRHLTMPLKDFVATFTDGIGVSRQHLQGNGYLRSYVGIWVPPLDAGTELLTAETIDGKLIDSARENYMSVLPEPVHMNGRFTNGVAPRLTKTAARWLFVTKYLKEGYVDTSILRRIGLKINDLTAVKNTLHSINEVTGQRGYVAFS